MFQMNGLSATMRMERAKGRVVMGEREVGIEMIFGRSCKKESRGSVIESIILGTGTGAKDCPRNILRSHSGSK